MSERGKIELVAIGRKMGSEGRSTPFRSVRGLLVLGLVALVLFVAPAILAADAVDQGTWSWIEAEYQVEDEVATVSASGEKSSTASVQETWSWIEAEYLVEDEVASVPARVARSGATAVQETWSWIEAEYQVEDEIASSWASATESGTASAQETWSWIEAEYLIEDEVGETSVCSLC